MSNTARKARKRAGVQFVHPVKTGTPVAERRVSDYQPPAPLVERIAKAAARMIPTYTRN
ncbi:hypothetical protein [Frondihabitans sp. VKM Ac-2883]|uniref:hypothetical protein n=1 Tax=Frondihabitans sp. VKM Ac-2883 TaxID=2783823 RepID=UPI00188AC716|nr:hypothetical protein [Frondihabitans sp. VKM Ac-2883]MBF4574712.1 hypothetical protein [Frondihabitans sp. VKM Ac-2883]